jgi:phenylalanyl-tRNA synthetase beta chain
MKISETWLREWCNPSLTSDALGAALTLAGLEVDSISPVAHVFSGVVVALVINTKPHPAADRLTVCEVDDGSGQHLQVVCGARNVRPGLKVALATIGAVLSPEFKIKETKLRGELSQGMLCSRDELGMQGASEGILELDESAPIGMNLREYLALDDQVFEIDLTPNRADCLSIQGVAREVAALTHTSLFKPSMDVRPPSHAEARTVRIKAEQACPRYALRVIKGLNTSAELPFWMKERLARSGIQAIHPIVDVVNYVMLELGQPMHAFDASAVEGDIEVRFAAQGESVQLLNEQQVVLDEQVLVIADTKKVIAMAGVMGGLNSAVGLDTTDIILESAYFNPLVMAGVARRFGLATDAAQRFERGVDPNLPVQALERVTQLLIEYLGGEAGPIVCEESLHHSFTRKKINFKPERFERITGVELSYDVMQDALQRLNFTVDVNDNVWVIEPPTYRFDMGYDVDIIEEILRLHGYDKIQARRVVTEMKKGSIHPVQNDVALLSECLAYRGYRETISYSFVDPIFQQQLFPDVETMRLLNPISPELSEMRVSLWPGLLSSLLYNQNRQQNTIRCFESGVVFHKQDGRLLEKTMFGGVMSGEQGLLNWCESSRPFDFFDLKGDLQALFRTMHIEQDVRFLADKHPALHPGQTARIFFKGTPVGWVGALHPHLIDELDSPKDIFLFELEIGLLTRQSVHYRKISKYPQIRRDLSLLMEQNVSVDEIETVVRCVVPGEQLKGFDIFDQYMGEHLPQGKKSIAIALTLQSDDRTLVDEEVAALMASLISELNQKLAITLRE